MTAQQMFNQGVSYTYDDVIMHPGHIDFGAHEVSERRTKERGEACGGGGGGVLAQACFFSHPPLSLSLGPPPVSF